MKNPVNWLEIYVQDLNKARKSHEIVLEIDFEEINDPSEEDEPVLQILYFMR